ncbi:MaoC/PaaZ C-terminal domain-containing protein [Amycolatopsis thermophila]|uniref:Acyl dehydratase n=1 Tax=Amycolatopsis thermophila TaxID=206084 RepID=A0ABU0F612_9PSEU|nr:MaoC/PaaZ C-terminal domain-containing protein [Amycolatopsis thermophila]MDQ0382823.1 acyl dehydratase [Amycolatopsis thermophila]
MAIDVNKAVGASAGSAKTTWSERDVVLYQLGLGAGADPLSERDLAYVLEDRLRVLPSYAVIPGSEGVRGLTDVPGLEFDHTKMLHGEHEIELFEPLPTAATVSTEGRVAAIYDKGSAALTVLEATSTSEDGRPLFVNRFSLFMRGAGGFGGPKSPPAEGGPLPQRAPDVVAPVPTLPQQALLYRLNGDVNPVHSDPRIAAKAGFDRPILHGLCTFGIVCKATVDGVLDGDTARVRRFRARFAGVVFPGETITVRCWREGTIVRVLARVEDRDADVLTNGILEVTGEETA